LNTLPHDHLLFQAMPKPKPLPLPTQERLQELFDYSVTTGHLYWRTGPYKGSWAGSENHKGYIRVRIAGITFMAHRLVWKWVTGNDPAQQLDHRDRDKRNNAWHNLREADLYQQSRNRAAPTGKTSGLPRGVRRNHSRYGAQLRVGKGIQHLGTYDTPEEAHQAYLQAVQEQHGDFAYCA